MSHVPLPCGLTYFEGCTCPPCSQYRRAAWDGLVPKLDRAQLEARIAHAREMGDLEPLRPAPRVSWADELRLRRLLWEIEDLLLDPLPGVSSNTGLPLTP
jgi:hypothetical protein